MSADATIKIDSDTTSLVGGAGKGEKAVKKIGTAAKAIGDEFTKAITKVGLLKAALTQAGNAAADMVNKATAANKRGGSRALDLSVSAASLGVQDIEGFQRNLRSVQSGVTAEERGSFVSALEASQGDARIKMTGAQAEEASLAYARGGDLLYGKGGKDLINGLGRGMSVADIQAEMATNKGAGLASLRAQGQTLEEWALRQVETTGGYVTDAARRDRGAQARAGAVQTDIKSAKSAASDAFSGLLPDAAKAGVDLGLGIDARRRVLELQDEQAGYLRKMARGTPQLAPGTEGVP